MRGSLGTHELRVGDLAIDVTANRFRVLRNEFGRLDINAMLTLRGQFEAPRLAGDITIDGDSLQVDQILERALFQPYSTEPVTITSLDAVAALNPWDRMGLDISLHIPRTLRLIGSDVQVSPGTPIGLGDINLRVGGDLYLYKDPGRAALCHRIARPGQRHLRVPGTAVRNRRGRQLDQLRRRPGSRSSGSRVTREISGVQTRVTISGSLRAARAAAGQHAAARRVRHPVAHRLQHDAQRPDRRCSSRSSRSAPARSRRGSWRSR